MAKPLFICLLILCPILGSAQGYFYTEGTVQINGGSAIEIKGDAVINQSINGNGFMVMNGDNPQTMGGSSANMNNLEVSNSADVTLADIVWVNDTLEMTSGVIYLDDNNLLLSDNTFHTGNSMGFLETNNTGVIQRKVDSTPFTFHVGYGTEYFPITITETGAADTFYVQGWNLLPDDGTSSGTAITSHVALLSYSVDDKNAGGNNLGVSMQWNDSKNAIDFVQPYAVGIWHNGSNYVEMDNCPTNVNSINPNIVTYSGITNVGTFGIGDSIYLSNIPSAVINPGDTSVCGGNSVTFTALPAGATSYLWSNSDATQNSIINTAGTYFVDVTDSTGCVYTSNGVTLTILSLPTTPTIIQTGNDLSVGGGYTSYQWYLNGSPISGANSSNYTVTGNGNYTVVVSGGNGCTANSSIYNFNTFGIEANANNNVTIVAMNGQIFIDMIPDATSKVSIYDAQGKIIYQNSFVSQYIPLQVETGIYIVVWQSVQQQVVKKVILQ